MMTTLGVMIVLGMLGVGLMRIRWLWHKSHPQAVPIRVRVSRWE